jgi:hypothetical protein
VSDRTPWTDIATEGAGWVIPLEDEASWVDAIAEVVGWDDAARQTYRAAALRFAASRAWNAEDIDKNRELFLRSLR